MRRSELEHLLRAAGAIAGEDEIVVIGSQAILATHPSPPPELVVSLEADVYPMRAPWKADLIDGSIGELSPFHETFGYYAHGVGPETARLPDGWQARLVKLNNPNTGGVTGLCLSLNDLAVSKLAAGRGKDLDYVRQLIAHGLVAKADVAGLCRGMPEEALLRQRLLLV
ncbi:MAG: DUF6036 family nucleotidyltransferase [Vulcanimicrobiota bacterium]